jgi:mycoredoxin
MANTTQQDALREALPADGQIVMYSTSWCGDCRRAKRVFAALGVEYTEINIEQDERAAELVVELNNGSRSVPTILFPDGTVLVEPSNAALEAKLAPFIAR